MSTTAHPLSWPAGYERTSWQGDSGFSRKTFGRVRDELLHDLDLMGADDVVLSTNIELRQDGFPYSGRRQPDDTGVAVYFTFKESAVVLCCDLWVKVEDNIWAVRKSVEAMRGIERWGVSDMLSRAFTGFKALPAPPTWQDILEVSEGASASDIKEAWRRKALNAHPDRGGSDQEMAELNNAYAESQTA